jgi:hypothetical protein
VLSLQTSSLLPNHRPSGRGEGLRYFAPLISSMAQAMSRSHISRDVGAAYAPLPRHMAIRLCRRSSILPRRQYAMSVHARCDAEVAFERLAQGNFRKEE